MDDNIEKGLEKARMWTNEGMGEEPIRRLLLKDGFTRDEIRIILNTLFKHKREVEKESKLVKTVIYLTIVIILIGCFYLFVWPFLLNIMQSGVNESSGIAWSWLTVNQSSQKISGYTVNYIEGAPLRDYIGYVCDYDAARGEPSIILTGVILGQNDIDCGCILPQYPSDKFLCDRQATLLYIIPANPKVIDYLERIERDKRVIITAKAVEKITWKDGELIPKNSVVAVTHTINQYK